MPKARPGPPRGGFGTNRIEALADGIFAVAMTLLVLDVKLPNGELFASDQALLARLLTLEHTFVIYLISFIVLGMFWVGHHAHFHFIRYVDHTLLWINLMFLFVITSIPFATDLLGDHYQLHAPFMLLRRPAARPGGAADRVRSPTCAAIAELADPSLTGDVARRIVRRTALFAIDPGAVDGRRVLQYAPRPVPLLPPPGRAFPAGPRRQQAPRSRHSGR